MSIVPPETQQLTLFETKDITTDDTRAQRVANGLQRQGRQTLKIISEGFLADCEEKEMILFRFARKCFVEGKQIVYKMGDFDVSEAFRLEREVNNETARFIEFLRFEERDGMLGAVIHPQNYILHLLCRHFCDRLPDEQFLIYDATHGYALLRKRESIRYMKMLKYDPLPSEKETEWQHLWKCFFKAVTIEERCNKKAQIGQVYKHFWQDMPEMQPDFP